MLLTLILINTAIIRFFRISEFPPLKHISDQPLRFLSGVASIVSVFLLYKFSYKYTKNKKIALCTSFIFSILPWTIEQGKLVSGVNLTLCTFLFLLWVLLKLKGLKKIVVIAGFPIALFLLYPSFWLFQLQNGNDLINIQSLTKNILFLTSTKLLFFENTTFWWGGVRLWGISLLVFAPLFVIGLIKILIEKNIKLLVSMGIVLFISALSNRLPESKEFYFITPLLSFCIGLGLISLVNFVKPKIVCFAIVTGILFLFIYEYQNFLHFYMTHYSERVRGSLNQINGPY